MAMLNNQRVYITIYIYKWWQWFGRGGKRLPATQNMSSADGSKWAPAFVPRGTEEPLHFWASWMVPHGCHARRSTGSAKWLQRSLAKRLVRSAGDASGADSGDVYGVVRRIPWHGTGFSLSLSSRWKGGT